MTPDTYNFIFGWVIGTVFTLLGIAVYAYLRFKLLMTKLDRAMTDVINEIEDKTVKMTVEEHDNIIYCYEEGTKDFICQGANMKEIEAAFDKRYPDKRARICGGDEKLIERLKQELKAT